jgi:hypothetical protein
MLSNLLSGFWLSGKKDRDKKNNERINAKGARDAMVAKKENSFHFYILHWLFYILHSSFHPFPGYSLLDTGYTNFKSLWIEISHRVAPSTLLRVMANAAHPQAKNA